LNSIVQKRRKQKLREKNKSGRMEFNPVSFKRPNKLNSNNMKKIFTLIAATFLTVAVFAVDRKPSVTLKSVKNYEIVIDGRTYQGSDFRMINVAGLRDGMHSITVYKLQQGFFFKKMKKAVSTKSFLLRGNDIDIQINQYGQIKIDEDLKFQKNRDNQDWNKKGNNNDYNNGRDQKGPVKDDHGKRF